MPETGLVTLEEGLPERRRDLLSSFWGGRSPKTVRAYKGCLMRVATWAGLETLDELARKLLAGGHGHASLFVHDFKSWAAEQDWAPAYVNLHLAALSSLIEFAHTMGAINWFLKIKGLRVQKYRDTRGPGWGGVVAIFKAAQSNDQPIVAARDTLIASLLGLMGLRRFEICQLDLEHLDLKNKRVSVLRKKKLTREWLTIPGFVLKNLVAWLNLRGTEPGPLVTGFFAHGVRRKTRLSDGALRKIVGELGERAGLGRQWPHAIRHAAITRVLELTNGNVRAAQIFAGHSDPKTTMIYDDNRKDVAGEIGNKLGDDLEAAVSDLP